MASASDQIPATPRVISPSPSLPDSNTGRESYFGPVTRSVSRANRSGLASQQPASIDEDSSSSDPEKRRARARSRSPVLEGVRQRRISGLTSSNTKSPYISVNTHGPTRRKAEAAGAGLSTNGTVNGHLSPESARSSNRSYWRTISRSPSPLGLIPIHEKWRSFIHRHEVPRKVLHVSIGFVTVYFYVSGSQTSSIHPWLLAALIPISIVDIVRHHSPSFNRFYIRVLGALMRETEVDGWNGVIWYLLGAWIVLRFFPKDVGVMGVLLLSWCDTAASTFGRHFGRYTPRVRKGKSLAGSLAAMLTGVATAWCFWGILAPRMPAEYDAPPNTFAFTGMLSLPGKARELLGWTGQGEGSVSGTAALGIMSMWAGMVASVSEAMDVFGWDDNLTIPVLCGMGLYGFLWTCG